MCVCVCVCVRVCVHVFLNNSRVYLGIFDSKKAHSLITNTTSVFSL